MTILLSILISALVLGTASAKPEGEVTNTALPVTLSTTLTTEHVIVDNITVATANTETREANVTEEYDNDEGWEYENRTIVDTRRILYSHKVDRGTRPYMVYLQLTKESAKVHKYRGWLCGGVIVDMFYVLTSAACVEDADHFYIVSGTTKYVDSFDYKSDDCVCKNRRRVVWKCIPKNYKFDFQDSIRWSSNDIAIVKVDKPFKFGVQERGCEFGVSKICYNNVSRELEKPGTKGWIAGWGSTNTFREGVYRRSRESSSTGAHIPQNQKCLQDARVCIMDNEQCAKKWAQRFRSIIQEYMICTKDVMKRISEICDKRYANCTDVEKNSRRDLDLVDIEDTNGLETAKIDLGRHLRDPDDYTARRASSSTGGFCENDHGGPLIVKYKNKERVIGVISACKIDPKSHSCHGPFLYTSVFKNRQFIQCSIHKDTDEQDEDNCRRVFRTGITHEEYDVSWDNVKEDDDGSNRDDGDDDDKEALRTAKEDTKANNKKEEPEKVVSKEDKDEESSAEEEEPKKDKKDSGEDRKEDKEEKKEKKKKKKRSGKKVEKKDKKESGEAKRRGHHVDYLSSADDNVNEPDEIK